MRASGTACVGPGNALSWCPDTRPLMGDGRAGWEELEEGVRSGSGEGSLIGSFPGNRST